MSKSYMPSTSDESVLKATGKAWTAWFDYLDGWAGSELDHKAIAAHLASLGVSAWWSQMVTVEWERHAGRRAVHQTSRGFEAQVSRTVASPPEDCWSTFTRKSIFEQWMGKGSVAELKKDGIWRDPNGVGIVSSATKAKRIGIAWEAKEGGRSQRLEIQFVPTKLGGTSVRITHSGLSNEKSVAAMKVVWKSALERLREALAAS